jgi:hypothetical protein
MSRKRVGATGSTLSAAALVAPSSVQTTVEASSS